MNNNLKKYIKSLLCNLGMSWLINTIKTVMGWLHCSIYCPARRVIRLVCSYMVFVFRGKADTSTVRSRKIISLLCPTRQRVNESMRFIQSVYRTAAHPDRVEIQFYVDSDDACLEGYRRLESIVKRRFRYFMRCDVHTGDPMSISKSWNILARVSKGDILVMSNDDQVFVDYGWDVVLDNESRVYRDDIYCLWFNDGTGNKDKCISPMVSRTWYTTLGYFTPGIFEFYCNDFWIWHIAEEIGRSRYIPGIMVEHIHYAYNKARIDDTYRRHLEGSGQDRILRDAALFQRTGDDRKKDAAKLKKVIEGA